MKFLLALALLLAPLAAAETIVMDSTEFCADKEPQSVWDYPLCSDATYDDVLLAAIEAGDRSATELALRRYREAPTWAQKLRLAPVLLHDPAVWSELSRHARNVLDSEVEGQYWELAVHAFRVIAPDPRSGALLRKGLETEVPGVVSIAISGLAHHGDLAALPFIDRALERMADEAHWMAAALEQYASDEARQVARKYLRTEDE